MRCAAIAFVLSATACGRIGFGIGDGASDASIDAMIPGMLTDGGQVINSTPVSPACDQSVSYALASGSPGTAPALVASPTHLIALWAAPNGSILRTSWERGTSGFLLVEHAAVVRLGAVAFVVGAASPDAMMVVFREGTALHALGLTSQGAPVAQLTIGAFELGGHDVVVPVPATTRFRVMTATITTVTTARLHEIGIAPPVNTVSAPIGALASHSDFGIVAVQDDVRVFSTSLSTSFDSNITRVSGSGLVISGPDVIESGQSDTSSVGAAYRPGDTGAVTAWLDGDPVNMSVAVYEDTLGLDSFTVGLAGRGYARPRIATNPDGFALVLETSSGVLARAAGMTRTLSTTASGAAIATVGSEIYVVMFEGDGSPSLTRLCP